MIVAFIASVVSVHVHGNRWASNRVEVCGLQVLLLHPVCVFLVSLL